METSADLAAFWSAIAQIVPVLALAFVLEARIIAARYSKKSSFTRRKRRIAWGLLFFVVGVLFICTESAAIAAISNQPTRALGWYDHALFVIAQVTVSLGLFVVVTIPIGGIVAGATADAASLVRMRVPWGEVQRLRRQLVRSIADSRELVVETRDLAHRALMGAASALIGPAEARRGIAPIERKLLALQSQGPDDAGREILRQLKELRIESEALLNTYDDWWESYQASQNRVRQAQTCVSEGVDRLALLDALIAQGGSTYDLEMYRKHLADAARR